MRHMVGRTIFLALHCLSTLYVCVCVYVCVRPLLEKGCRLTKKRTVRYDNVQANKRSDESVAYEKIAKGKYVFVAVLFGLIFGCICLCISTPFLHILDMTERLSPTIGGRKLAIIASLPRVRTGAVFFCEPGY